jgi:multiple sugar transport system substrate-binding protein
MVMMIGVIGCSTNSAPSTKLDGSNKPVEQPPKVEAPAEMVFFTAQTITPDDFQAIFADALAKKFPNTKFTQLQESANNKLDGLIASKAAIDLAQYPLTNSAPLMELEFPLNLTSLVTKYHEDLSRFDPAAIKEFRSYSADGQLMALPFSQEMFVLYYNKDIFDKFGVAYPKQGSTWDELIELSRKLTREQDGVQYKGLSPGLNINRIQTQLSNPFVDPKTQKSLVMSTPGWSKMFQTYLNVYSVPGNTPGNGTQEFVDSKNLAMFPHLLKAASNDNFQKGMKEGLKIGVTTFPVFKEAPDTGPGYFGNGLYIPKMSRYPDFAFQVMQYLLSDEVQIQLEKTGQGSALVSPKVRNSLLEGNPLAKEIGFDISFVKGMKLASSYQKTQWDSQAAKIVNDSISDVSSKKKDINTALREADEAVNQMILANPPKK